MTKKSNSKNKKAIMPWLDAYPDGISWGDSFKDTSMVSVFDEIVKKYPDNPCTDFLGAIISYGEMGEMTNRFAAGLKAKGYGKGDRIGIYLPNIPYYVAAYFAILKIGATVVNFNPLYTVDEVRFQAGDASISAMITLDIKRLYDKISELVDDDTIETIIVCPFADMLTGFKSIMYKMFKSSGIASVTSSDRVLLWDDLCNNDGSFTPASIDLNNDIALLQYTGGTTGTPKGSMLTHANIAISVRQTLRWCPQLDEGNERIMGILPFFHVFAMTTVLNFGIATGSLMILLPKFEQPLAAKTFSRTGATIMPGVPTLYKALMDYEDMDADSLSELKFCISGGAPLPLEVRLEFEKFSGCTLVEGYGLSETAAIVSCNPFIGEPKANSVGQPVPGTIVSIRSLDDPAVELPVGESGEICVKGPQVMKGYWNRPNATERTFSGDYFRTGDVGYFDDDGFIYIIDRIKDMIICSGYKVYPRRIEDALYEHPAIAETTVIGIKDEYRGEAPKAFIVLKKGHSASQEEIMQHLEQRISKIELPEEIEFRDQLPKTIIGKLSKKDLREQQDQA